MVQSSRGQARRQDFTVGGENHKGGAHFLMQYWMYAATGGPNI